jgi:hypothetical protein
LRVLCQVVESGDNYGLQAVVAELERSGRYADVMQEVNREPGSNAQRMALALEAAHARLALEPEAHAGKKDEVGVA